MDLSTVSAAAADVGPWAVVLGLIGAGIRAIITGALVPRSTLDVLTAQWEARLSEKDDRLAESHEREEQWREAHGLEVKAGDLRDAQIGRLMSLAEAADRMLQALPRRKDETP